MCIFEINREDWVSIAWHFQWTILFAAASFPELNGLIIWTTNEFEFIELSHSIHEPFVRVSSFLFFYIDILNSQIRGRRSNFASRACREVLDWEVGTLGRRTFQRGDSIALDLDNGFNDVWGTVFGNWVPQGVDRLGLLESAGKGLGPLGWGIRSFWRLERLEYVHYVTLDYLSSDDSSFITEDLDWFIEDSLCSDLYSVFPSTWLDFILARTRKELLKPSRLPWSINIFLINELINGFEVSRRLFNERVVSVAPLIILISQSLVFVLFFWLNTSVYLHALGTPSGIFLEELLLLRILNADINELVFCDFFESVIKLLFIESVSQVEIPKMSD